MSAQIDSLRRLGSRLEGPSDRQRQQARSALQAAMSSDAAAPGPTRRTWTLSNRFRILLVGLAALLLSPAAVAAVDGLYSDTPYEPAAACEEANAAYRQLGVEVKYFMPNCPSAIQLQQDIRLLSQPSPLIRQCIEAREAGTATDTCEKILGTEADEIGKISPSTP